MQSVFGLKEKIVSLGNAVMLFSPLETLVREVTSNEPYPAKASSKEEIAKATQIGYLLLIKYLCLQR
jgi:hypothetical protein